MDKVQLKTKQETILLYFDDESNDELHFVFTSSEVILLTISQTLPFNVMQ